MTFDELWNMVSKWADTQEKIICSTGRALTANETVAARSVGVNHPEKIRILVVTAVPFPEDPGIKQIGAAVGLTSENTAGMTLGYGIYLRSDQTHRMEIWPHEFRHVAQYECLGSTQAFMYFYLKEMLHFKYGPGPLEIDARVAEKTVSVR